MSDYPRYMTLAFSETGEAHELLAKTSAQVRAYEKVEWEIENKDGKAERKGLRYGENPSQPAALYRPINGTLRVNFGGPHLCKRADAVVAAARQMFAERLIAETAAVPGWGKK